MLSKRTLRSTTTQGSADRLVTCFLTEMDGIFTQTTQANVFVVAGN